MFLFLEYVSANKTQTYSSHTHAYSLLILVLWAWDPRSGKRQTCFSVRMSLLCRWCVKWVWTCSKSASHLRRTHEANKKRDSWIIDCHKFIINPIKHWGCRWLPGSATHWLGMKDFTCFLKAFVEADVRYLAIWCIAYHLCVYILVFLNLHYSINLLFWTYIWFSWNNKRDKRRKQYKMERCSSSWWKASERSFGLSLDSLLPLLVMEWGLLTLKSVINKKMPYKFKHSIKQEVISAAQKLWHIAANKLLCLFATRSIRFTF